MLDLLPELTVQHHIAAVIGWILLAGLAYSPFFVIGRMRKLIDKLRDQGEEGL